MKRKYIENYSCISETKEGIPERYGIEMQGAKVIDLSIDCYNGGCCCSLCNDRNKYDKESNTIICKDFNKCLANVWKHLQDGQRSDIKQIIKMALGEEQ